MSKLQGHQGVPHESQPYPDTFLGLCVLKELIRSGATRKQVIREAVSRRLMQVARQLVQHPHVLVKPISDRASQRHDLRLEMERRGRARRKATC